MWRLLIGVVIVVLVGVVGCRAFPAVAGLAGAERPKGAPVPATPTAVGASWNGVRLLRPEWCRKGIWANVYGPMGAVVPACLQGDKAVYSGVWETEGCTPYGPVGVSLSGSGLMRGRDGRPDLAYFTVCGG